MFRNDDIIAAIENEAHGKPWYKQKTTITAAVAVIASGLNLFVDDPALKQKIVDFIMTLGPIALIFMRQGIEKNK